MISTNLSENLRPNVWENLLGLSHSVTGTETQKETLQRLAKSGSVRNLMFWGPPGTGKTSAARLFAATLLNIKYEDLLKDSHYKEINASNERGIDAMKDLEARFMSIATGDKKPRICVFDEADGLTYQAQEVLKASTARWSHNCIFIYCLNKIDRMDDAIISRCMFFEFDKIPYDEAIKWLEGKCYEYDIKVSGNVLVSVVNYFQGDMRRIVNSFIDGYRGKTVNKFEPSPSYANEIFKANDMFAKYLSLAQKHFIEPKQLIEELFVLNGYKNPKEFNDALLAIRIGANPIIPVATAINAITKG